MLFSVDVATSRGCCSVLTGLSDGKRMLLHVGHVMALKDILSCHHLGHVRMFLQERRRASVDVAKSGEDAVQC